MGLDQYLHAKRYVSGYNHSSDEGEKAIFHGIVEAAGANAFFDPDTPSVEVQFTAAYWRKSNMIHHWFVQVVQRGVDDCGEYYVERDQLVQLRDLCKRLLEKKDTEDAEALLPTAQGFFFGSTEISEWYWSDLEDTVMQLDRALEHTPEQWTFYYQSSW